MKGFCDKSNWSCQDPAASSPWQKSQVCCGGRLEIRRTSRILEGLHFNTDKVAISILSKFIILLGFLREPVAFCCYFSSFEALTSTRNSKDNNLWLFLGNTRFWHLTYISHILVSAGGMAGICSWVTTYPQDVIKSRVQGDGWGRHQRYHGPRHCLRVSVSLQFCLTIQCFV